MREFDLVTESTTFKCRRCAKCCSLDVMLSDAEMKALGKNADRRWRTTKKVKSGGDRVCALLEGNSCGIYGERPKLCRVYPFMAAPVSEFKELGLALDPNALRHTGSDGEEYVAFYDETCPGIGHGGSADQVQTGSIVELTIAHIHEFGDGCDTVEQKKRLP